MTPFKKAQILVLVLLAGCGNSHPKINGPEPDLNGNVDLGRDPGLRTFSYFNGDVVLACTDFNGDEHLIANNYDFVYLTYKYLDTAKIWPTTIFFIKKSGKNAGDFLSTSDADKYVEANKIAFIGLSYALPSKFRQSDTLSKKYPFIISMEYYLSGNTITVDIGFHNKRMDTTHRNVITVSAYNRIIDSIRNDYNRLRDSLRNSNKNTK